MLKFILMLNLVFAGAAPTSLAKEAVVTVNGMVCSFCAQGIEKKLKALPAVESVGVDMDNKKVTVHFKDKQDVSDKDLSELITKEAGFAVVKIERK